MYDNVWAKYLAVIRIVMKRSLRGEQTLPLNAADFERAGMKRKSGYKFSFALHQGKPKNVIIDLPLASSLANQLLEDEATRELINAHEFHFSLSPKYVLTIQHVPQPEEISVSE